MSETTVNLKPKHVDVIKDLCRFSAAWGKYGDDADFLNFLKICITPETVAFEATDGYKLGYLLLNNVVTGTANKPTFYAVNAAKLYKALLKNTSHLMFGDKALTAVHKEASQNRLVPYVSGPKWDKFYFGSLSARLTEPKETNMAYNLDLAYQGWAWLAKIRDAQQPLPAVEQFKVAYTNPLVPENGTVMWVVVATVDGDKTVQAAYLVQPITARFTWARDTYAPRIEELTLALG